MATTPYPFVASTVLTALQLNSTFNIPTTTLTASHTLTAADAGTRVYMNSASATTITANTSIFSASDVVEIFNIGAGVTTLTAGTATVSSAGPLAIPQYGSGRLTFTAAGASIYTPSAVTVAAGGLTLISATTIGSGVTSVTVSSCFSSAYENYKIIIIGGVGSSDGILNTTLGTTATGYYQGLIYLPYDTASSSFAINAQNKSSFILGCYDTNTVFVDANIYAPNLAKRTVYYNARTINKTNGQSGLVSGFENSATQHTSFTMTTESGHTLTGGTIRIYGYLNS